MSSMKFLALAVIVVVTAGCEGMPLMGGGLSDEVVVTAEEGLFARTEGKDELLKVTVKDADGNYLQDARVIVDLGEGGQDTKVTDGTGLAMINCKLKQVKAIKVQKTEKTRKAGT